MHHENQCGDNAGLIFAFGDTILAVRECWGLATSASSISRIQDFYLLFYFFPTKTFRVNTYINASFSLASHVRRYSPCNPFSFLFYCGFVGLALMFSG